jgi:hypothetical protein
MADAVPTLRMRGVGKHLIKTAPQAVWGRFFYVFCVLGGVPYCW